ncbi:hypothetical protein [Kitasatospora sp. NPDC001132]
MATQESVTDIHERHVEEGKLPQAGTVYVLHSSGYAFDGTYSMVEYTEDSSPAELVVHWAHKKTGKCTLAVVRGGADGACRPGYLVTAHENLPWTRPVWEMTGDKLEAAVWQLIPKDEGEYYLWNVGRTQYAEVREETGNRYLLHFCDTKEKAAVFHLDALSTYESVLNLYKEQLKPSLALPNLITNKKQPPECALYDNVHKNPPEDPVPGTQLAGVCAIPYYLVTDGKHSQEWQGEKSPYYLMRRESCWHLSDKNFKIYARGVKERKYWEVMEGTSEEYAQEVDKKTQWSVTAEAGFSYGGIGAKASGTYGEELNVKTSSKRTKSHSKKQGGDYEVSPPDNDDLAVADFFRQDEYTVCRVTGEEILRFKTWHSDPRISRTFPKGKD